MFCDCAHASQSVVSFFERLVGRISVLHCVHRASVSSANSTFKEQTKHSVSDPSKKLVVQLALHVLHVRITGFGFVNPREIAAVHATQDPQWPG